MCTPYQTYCGDHIVRYINVKSLCCMPETNILWFLKKFFKETKEKQLCGGAELALPLLESWRLHLTLRSVKAPPPAHDSILSKTFGALFNSVFRNETAKSLIKNDGTHIIVQMIWTLIKNTNSIKITSSTNYKAISKVLQGYMEPRLPAEWVNLAGVVLSRFPSWTLLVLCHLLISSLSTYLQVVTPLYHKLFKKLQRIF